MTTNSEIKSFFKNQTVFLTGATGFLGKVILEKLLRCCEDVSKIYVLIRPKKNQSSEDRFKELFDFQCFEPLKATNTAVFQKVHLMYGDCEKYNFGLKDEDIKTLKKETSCIIHAAASVKFDQPLKGATSYVRATRDLIEIAKEMPNLRSFVYVSTFYANCVHPHITEDFYKPPIKPDELISLVNALDDQTLEAITPKLLGKYPNTYIYTKCVSEDLIKSAVDHLPIKVVRPAIIHSAVSEPLIGWIDNFYGPTGVIAGACVGVLRSLYGKKSNVTNIVPVDYVSNVILVAATKNTDKVIFNYAGDKGSELTWGTFVEKANSFGWEFPSNQAFWHLCFEFRSNKLWHEFCVFFLHTCPAYFIDFILMIIGRKTMAVKMYEKINKYVALISYFTSNNWSFHNDNVRELWNNMTDSDREIFNFDMTKFDWDTYIYNYAKWGRIFVLKEQPESIPSAQRRKFFLLIVHYCFLALFWYLMYKLTMTIFNIFT